MSRFLQFVSVGIAVFGLCAATAVAGSISVSAGTSSHAIQEDFSGASWSEYSGVLSITGAGLAQSFSGQTVTDGTTFETVSGTPSDPLTLATASSGDGLYTYSVTSGGYVAGLFNGTANSSIGEGAVSILFDTAQTSFGFLVHGIDGYRATQGDGSSGMYLQFFDSDGSLLDTATVSFSSTTSFDTNFVATAAGGTFSGVTITNTDLEGLAYSDMRYALVPLPSAAWIGFGLLGALGVIRRVRRRKAA